MATDVWYYVKHRDGLLKVSLGHSVEFLAVLRESSVVTQRKIWVKNYRLKKTKLHASQLDKVVTRPS